MTRRLAAAAAFVLALGPELAAGSSGGASTGVKSADFEVRKLPGGAVLRVAAGTQYHIGRPITVQVGHTPGKATAQTVRLTRGRIEVDLPEGKSPTTAVLVQGPSRISAIAKGGHSVVIVDAQRVTVAAVSGDMLVATGDDWRTLQSGVVRDYNGGTVADHAVLAAPSASLSAPMALSVVGGQAGNPVQARASKLAHAKGYVFDVWQVQNNQRELLQRISAAGDSVALPQLPAGSYAVSVHGVEASGLEGAHSAPVPLRVVSAELPEGARLTDSGILLPPNQRVKLLGTDGVEVSYGKVAGFVPAPSTIGLIRGESTLVRLRARGAKEEYSLQLAPRATHAQIKLGPARAHWPEDHISVAVQLTDGRGKPLADDIAVTPSVFVNVAPVKVDWKRERNVLTATVPPSSGPGPWVVRVEVTDDTKAVVGRNFLEVAMRPDAPRVN